MLETLSNMVSHTEHDAGFGNIHARHNFPRFNRSGMLSHGGTNTPFRLLTLAHQGLMGECDTPLPAGTRVGLSIGGETSVAAVLCWVRGKRFGARLGSPLDRAKLEEPGRAAMRSKPRAPRFQTDARVTARYGLVAAPVRIRNISSCGCMIEAALLLRVGQAVELELPSLPPLRGRVRWSRMGRAGLMLEAPLNEYQLQYLRPLPRVF